MKDFQHLRQQAFAVHLASKSPLSMSKVSQLYFQIPGLIRRIIEWTINQFR